MDGWKIALKRRRRERETCCCGRMRRSRLDSLKHNSTPSTGEVTPHRVHRYIPSKRVLLGYFSGTPRVLAPRHAIPDLDQLSHL